MNINVTRIMPPALTALAAFAVANSIAGCARRERTVVVEPVVVTQPASTPVTREIVVVRPEPPPPAPSEITPPAPGRGYVWVSGAYEWNGERWDWVSGHWERPVRASAVWVPGEWRQTRGGWYWDPGHWR